MFSLEQCSAVLEAMQSKLHFVLLENPRAESRLATVAARVHCVGRSRSSDYHNTTTTAAAYKTTRSTPGNLERARKGCRVIRVALATSMHKELHQTCLCACACDTRSAGKPLLARLPSAPALLLLLDMATISAQRVVASLSL